MAATPESKVKDKIKKVLEDNHVYYAMPIGSGYGRSGVPDFLCCVAGQFLAIEAKATSKDTPTALQIREMKRIEASHGMAMVIHEGNVGYLQGLIKLIRGPEHD